MWNSSCPHMKFSGPHCNIAGVLFLFSLPHIPKCVIWMHAKASLFYRMGSWSSALALYLMLAKEEKRGKRERGTIWWAHDPLPIFTVVKQLINNIMFVVLSFFIYTLSFTLYLISSLLLKNEMLGGRCKKKHNLSQCWKDGIGKIIFTLRGSDVPSLVHWLNAFLRLQSRKEDEMKVTPCFWVCQRSKSSLWM